MTAKRTVTTDMLDEAKQRLEKSYFAVCLRDFDKGVRHGYTMGNVSVDQLSAIYRSHEQLTKENEELRQALIELLKHNPKRVRIGGIENGYYRDAGAAVIKVIERCEKALESGEQR